MAGFTHLAPDEDFPGDLWDAESQVPTVSHFANAVQIWALAQDNDVSVNDVAVAFNCRPEMVRQAIGAHAFMDIGAGGVILHEGE